MSPLSWLDNIADAVFGPPAPPPAHTGSFQSSRRFLKPHFKGFCLTGRRSLRVVDSLRNAAIFGGTGTGKSATVLIPSLLSMQGSFMVHDPSGELYQKTAGFLAYRGYQVRRLNFADPDNSDRYNPLSRATTSSDSNKVAKLLVGSVQAGGKGDPFWDLQATTLLNLLIQVAQKSKRGQLSQVRILLMTMRSKPEIIQGIIQELEREDLSMEFAAFISFDEKVKAGIVATCLSALQLLTDQKVVTVTNSDTIDFDRFRRRPTALFIQNPVADASYYASLSALLFEQFLQVMLTSVPTGRHLPVFLLLDEASSLHLPTLPIAMANVRKYHVGILLALQAKEQLIATYGKDSAETILSNCLAKLYFTGQSATVGSEIEQLTGQALRPTDTGALLQPLMTAAELRTLPKDRALLLLGNQSPILVKLRPYYRQRTLREKVDLPTPSYVRPPDPPLNPVIPSPYFHGKL